MQTDIKFTEINAYTPNIAAEKAEKFERSKNLKAGTYTLGITALLLLVFVTISWQTPHPKLPIVEDIVEISLAELNLGNEQDGYGKIQPLIKGDYAPLTPTAPAPTPKTVQAPSNSTNEPNNPIVNNNNNDDAPTMLKPVVKPLKPSRTFTPVTTTTPRSRPTPAAINTTRPIPTPAPPRPRALMSPNGTSNGGNNITTTNDAYSQGNRPGANGDRGGYNGTPTGTGTKLTNANLRNQAQVEQLAGQSGTNYKGKVILNLNINENGQATIISVSTSTATGASSQAKTFARGLVPNMRFAVGADNRTARIVLDFDF